MQDGKIEIGTKLDTGNLTTGLNKVKQSLENLDKSAKLSAFAKLGTSVSSVSNIFSTVTQAIAKAKQAVDQCIESFNKQKGAEVALSTAAKNNPYLNGQSVKKLKEFASEMQNISAVGDEEILPLMAQLASAGRTQEEIQNIIQASLDISASGAMSLESAVKNLNKSFSGLSGELGESVPAIKNLTQEELKQGKAVQVIASQYKGMAQEVTNSIGTRKRLSNAFGDLAEEVGNVFNKMVAPIEHWIGSLVGGVASGMKSLREFQDSAKETARVVKALDNGTATKADSDIYLEGQGKEDYTKEVSALQELKDYYEEVKQMEFESEEAKRNKLEAMEQEIKLLQESVDKHKERYALAKSINITERERSKILKQQEETQKKLKEIEEHKKKLQEEAWAKANDTASSAINSFNSTIAQFEKEIEVRKRLGEQIDDETYAQEKLNVMTNAYIQARKSAGTTISNENKFSKASEADLAELQQQVDDINLLAKVDLELNPEIDPKDYEKLAQESTSLLEDANKLEVLAQKAHQDKKFELEKEYLEKVDALKEKSREKEKEAKSAQFTHEAQQLESSLQIAADFLDKYAEMTNQIVALQTERIDNETKARHAALEKEYRQGLITEEEYEQKKKEIDKKAAQDKYKLEMWQWTANLATATGSIALGIINALGNSPNPAIGIAMASIIGAMGAIQLASVIASKPIPPSFSTGGIVGGSSYYGDKVQGNLNSREMILNMGQQKNLFDSINSNRLGNTQPNIVINNSASNIVNAEPVISKNQIELLIDARVNDSLKRGRLNNSLNHANASMTGTFYGV